MSERDKTGERLTLAVKTVLEAKGTIADKYNRWKGDNFILNTLKRSN